jgi:maleate cis-trans isomerase
MYGWRTRIGVIVPSCNVTLEPEFYRMVPEGISVHFASARILEDTPE